MSCVSSSLVFKAVGLHGRERESAGSYGSSEGPDVRGCTPSEIEHRFGASKDGGTDDMKFFDGVDMGAVSTIGQLDVAEADTVGAMVDEDVVGLNVYDHE